jgi:hypothetical protein
LIDQMQRRIGVPASVRGTFAGTAEAFQKSLSTEPLLILTALLAIYIVLGMLYESLVHPITILTTLPSASVGAIIALILFHSELDVISIIGIFLLIGIVKKNAIMMIDFALIAEREHGKNTRDAIFEACMLRFRPILMTTMAALFGALPLAFGTGMGSELRRPLGVAIAGGLLFSQVLTLYTTPIIYLYFDRISNRFKRRPSDAPLVSSASAKLQAPWARLSRSCLRAATRRGEKTESRIRERSSLRGCAAPQKRETGRPWPRRFAAWGRRSVISETLQPRGSTTQAQRRCIGRSGRRRDWHTQSGTRRIMLREECRPAEAEPLYLEAATIYRKQGEEAALDLANTLRGLALAAESSGQTGGIQTTLAGGAPVVRQVQRGGRRCGV